MLRTRGAIVSAELQELPYDTIFTASMARRIEAALNPDVEPVTHDGELVSVWWDRVAVPHGFMPHAEWKATDNGTVSGVMINALIRMAIGRES